MSFKYNDIPAFYVDSSMPFIFLCNSWEPISLCRFSYYGFASQCDFLNLLISIGKMFQ